MTLIFAGEAGVGGSPDETAVGELWRMWIRSIPLLAQCSRSAFKKAYTSSFTGSAAPDSHRRSRRSHARSLHNLRSCAQRG